jgi:ribosomal protein S18 acetylase RimI-like enzyme
MVTDTGVVASATEQVEIREITADDAVGFVEFMEEMVSETNFLLQTPDEVNRDVDKQRKMIENFGDQRKVFIAHGNNRIVGFMGLTRFGMNKMKHVANFSIGVLKSYGRRGIASKLLAKGEEWLKSAGVRRVEMTVAVPNTEAISFYRKFGFKEEGQRIGSLNIDGKLVDELYMAKILD